MKRITLFTIVCMALNGMSDASNQQRWQAFYSRLGAKSLSALLRLLCDVPTKYNDWHMGDTGPDDIDSCQIRVLYSFWNAGRYPDGSSLLINEHWQLIGTPPQSDDPAMRQWLDLLAVPPSDSAGILKMLGDPSPTVRFLGLKKASSLEELPKAVTTKLESMARKDDRVAIYFIRDPDFEQFMHTGDYGHNDFVCQFRNDAASILQKHGKDITVDNRQVALRGLTYLNELVKEGRSKGAIVSALFNLREHGGRLWLEALSKRRKYPQFAALFEAWDEAKRRGSVSEEGFKREIEGGYQKRKEMYLAVERRDMDRFRAAAGLPPIDWPKVDNERLAARSGAPPSPPRRLWLCAGIALLLSVCAALCLVRRKLKTKNYN